MAPGRRGAAPLRALAVWQQARAGGRTGRASPGVGLLPAGRASPASARIGAGALGPRGAPGAAALGEVHGQLLDRHEAQVEGLAHCARLGPQLGQQEQRRGVPAGGAPRPGLAQGAEGAGGRGHARLAHGPVAVRRGWELEHPDADRRDPEAVRLGEQPPEVDVANSLVGDHVVPAHPFSLRASPGPGQREAHEGRRRRPAWAAPPRPARPREYGAAARAPRR